MQAEWCEYKGDSGKSCATPIHASPRTFISRLFPRKNATHRNGWLRDCFRPKKQVLMGRTHENPFFSAESRGLACNPPLFSYLYGGDDGARTRDLCRDSRSLTGNLLKLKRTGGSESAQRQSKSPNRTQIEPRLLFKSRGLE
jgi:hypothetical protein